jgi:hypothetical protein
MVRFRELRPTDARPSYALHSAGASGTTICLQSLESEVAAFLVEVDEDVKALLKLGDQS